MTVSRGRIWRDGTLVSAQATVADVAAVQDQPGVLWWLELGETSAAELATLAATLGFSPAIVPSGPAVQRRPAVTRHGDILAFDTYATRLEADRGGREGALTVRPISGLVLASGLITLRAADAVDLDEVVTRWQENADLLAAGPGALLFGLLSLLVDGHFAVIEQLDDVIEDLEDELFEGTVTGHGFLQIYGLRKDLVRLRRILLPMREVVNTLIRHRVEADNDLMRWYDDLYDHVLRASEWTESLRDMVTSLFETNLSLQDAHLNEVMKKLAGWAAIIAVPTAITGWFGQNVPYLGFSQPLGLWLSLVSIAGCSLLLYVVFRRRDWL